MKRNLLTDLSKYKTNEQITMEKKIIKRKKIVKILTIIVTIIYALVWLLFNK